MNSDSNHSFCDGDFGFAFNNATFSNRLLRIEITRGGDEVSCSSVVEWVRDRKRRREDVNNNLTHTNELDLAPSHIESCDINNTKHDDEAMLVTEQNSKSGGEDVIGYYRKLTDPTVLRVRELHVSSAILAAKSPFFYKLFSNGMLESEQKHLTLKIDVSEEVAVMELLHFMYKNTVSVRATPRLVEVLMVADKFQVTSLMKLCSRLLLNRPMTLDNALLVLHLPSYLLTADPVQPLGYAARQFLTSRYKDISKFPIEELLALPLVGMETILESDDLRIASEDIVYELVLKWLKSNYPVVQERQDILGTHLARFIRFPYMSCSRLRKILTSDDFRESVASKLVLEALFFKAEPNREVEQPWSGNHRLVQRAYKYKPIKTLELNTPRRQCIVYLDLKHKDCVGLYPAGRMYSQGFQLGGQGFFLSAHCNMDQLSMFRCFGVFLGMEEKGSASLTVDYEFSARSKPTEEFVGRYKGNYKFVSGKAIGYRNLFSIPWEIFIAKDCPYFINDVLHLRAELSLRN